MSSTKSEHFRPDIQALRTVAVALVVVFHFWPRILTGGFIGVDVFFVISGFLITSHILRDVERNQFSVARFWARRVRRLLPASFTVVAATIVTIAVVVPKALWSQWLSECIASIFYFENWVLAANAVDYLALSNSASPTQHFWSLSVEEQFYIIWPLLIALALLIARKLGAKAKRISLLMTLLSVTAASLVFGILDTSNEAAVAYFSTPVRAWEFGIGSLVAFLPAVKDKAWSRITAILGFALIIIAGSLFTTKIDFPGSAALLPVLATAAVIWVGANGGVLGKILEFRPVQFIGDHSYSIYLWHWPLLILAPYALHSQHLSLRVKCALIAATIVLAYLSVKFIERPFMSSGLKPKLRPRAVFAILAVVSTLLAGSAYAVMQVAAKPISDNLNTANQLANQLPKCFGALALQSSAAPCVNKSLQGLYPSLDAAASDSFYAKANCALPLADEWKPKKCSLGIASAKIRIALVGDSHIAHYSGAFDRLGKIHGWAVDIYSKGRCAFTDAVNVKNLELSPSCKKFIPAVEAKVLAGHYDLIVTSRASINEAAAVVGAQQERQSQIGLVSMWSKFTSLGIPVIVIKDSPRPIANVLRCLGLKSIDACSISAKKAFKFDPQVGAVAMGHDPLITLVNLDRLFCVDSICKPVIGHVVVYKDFNHLTNTYSKSLSPFIEPFLIDALNKTKLGTH